MSDDKKCANCQFFYRKGLHTRGEDNGSCRRFPPAGNTDGMGRFSLSPHVSPDHWCGEFIAADEKPE